MDPTLEGTRQLWDRYAQTDPLWAVLSDPAKQGRQWQLDEFMRNGEREISLLLYQIHELGLTVRRRAALDFGSGVGRLTQALARRFDRVVGVDVSPRMVEIASKLNRYPDVASYWCNPHADLRELPSASFDFLYSNIVLQHIPPEWSIGYIREFFRVVAKGGLVVFQIPSHLDTRPKGAVERMPDAAYRAELSLRSRIPAAVPPSSELSLSIDVTNASDHDWRQAEAWSIRAGNHWLDPSGAMLIQDDGRAFLPATLRAGERYGATLTIRTPSRDGVYRAEIDLVHEGVTWFQDKGSRALQFELTVRSDAAHTGRALQAATTEESRVPDYSAQDLARLYGDLGPAGSSDPFPMYGVPQAQVLAIIGEEGGTVARVEDDGYGAEWIGYRYFVTV